MLIVHQKSNILVKLQHKKQNKEGIKHPPIFICNFIC